MNDKELSETRRLLLKANRAINKALWASSDNDHYSTTVRGAVLTAILAVEKACNEAMKPRSEYDRLLMDGIRKNGEDITYGE